MQIQRGIASRSVTKIGQLTFSVIEKRKKKSTQYDCKGLLKSHVFLKSLVYNLMLFAGEVTVNFYCHYFVIICGRPIAVTIFWLGTGLRARCSKSLPKHKVSWVPWPGRNTASDLPRFTSYSQVTVSFY